MTEQHTQDNKSQLTEIKYKSCIAQVLHGEKVASIQSITSETEGKGHAKTCIIKIEQFAKENSIKEVWFPMVINPKLEMYLKKVGYNSKTEIHPAMKEEVEIFVKEIK